MGNARRKVPCRVLALAAFVLLVGCASEAPRRGPGRPPDEVRAQLLQLLPAEARDRIRWAVDIQSAFEFLGVPPSTENLCAVLAVTEQESTFTANPEVPGLAKIAREEIDRRAARYHVPKLAVRAALALKSPDGRSYAERIAKVRTEQELSEIFEDLVAEVPLGRRLFGGANPVRTGGPMQVSIAFAERHARRHGYPYPHEGPIRHAVFTRRGGLYYGIAHLLDYPSAYERHVYRFADFNAGRYASRNAAFQAAVSAATGAKLELDGDLVLHDAKRGRIGATESAVRRLAPQLGMGDAQIRRALERGDEFEFERSELYARVFGIAEAKTGRALPRAVIPRIALSSPKITRKLTTEWFATRVQARYQRCVNRAFAKLAAG